MSVETEAWAATRGALTVRMEQSDTVYKDLAEEKLRGWQSEAVSALWQARTRKFKTLSTGNRANDMKRFTPDETKYFKFYVDVLHTYAPDLFKKSGIEERFIDVGAAPGGLSKYLITECGWCGYAFSLSPAESGLEMKYMNPKSLRFSMANMTKENEWRRVLTMCQKSGFSDVHFVNVGVVVDFGQVDADGGGNSEMACRSIFSSISQLLIVLNSLKDGGSAMWIHSLSHLDTLFFFLQYLVKCFKSIRILNTLAPARSPVYIIMQGFRKDSDAVEEFEKILLRDNGTVSSETITKWQVHDFDIIQRIMSDHQTIRDDIHHIWNQKRECLKETRVSAERRFKESDPTFNSRNYALLSGRDRPAPQIGEPTPDEGDVSSSTPLPNTAASVCSVGSNETTLRPTSLLTTPRTFGPPSRKP
jgi:hypothetical protein